MSFDLSAGMITAFGTAITAIGGVALKFLHELRTDQRELKDDQLELGNHKATENTEMIVNAINDAAEKQTATLCAAFNAGNAAVISAVRGEHRPSAEV